MTFRYYSAWDDEPARDEEDLDLTGASPEWLRVSCLRCGRTWQPRSASPKQCRWCKSRAWRTKAGSIPLGRPPAAKIKAAKKA